MTQDRTRPAIGGGGGGTAGTGAPEAAGESANVAQAEREPGAEESDSLAAGDASTDAAIGGGGGKPAGTGGSPARSGRSTSEGGGSGGSAPDPGDPGGMGGAQASSRTPQDRPPGGISPMDSDSESQDR